MVGWAGQTKRCLTSCDVMPQSTQTLNLASFLIHNKYHSIMKVQLDLSNAFAKRIIPVHNVSATYSDIGPTRT